MPPGVHSYALLLIGYPMGRFGPVRRVALAEIVYEDRWGEPYGDRYQSKGLSRDLSPRTMTAYRRDALKGEPRHVGTKNPAIGLFTGKMTIMRQPGGGHLTIITN